MKLVHGAALAAALLAAAPAGASPLISEVYYDAVGSDDGQSFVELYGTPGASLAGLVIEGINVEGDDVKKTVAVQLGKPGEGRKRLAEAGLTLSVLGPEVRTTGVKFGSRAKKSGFEQGWKVAAIKVPNDRPSEHWIYLPALALLALVWFLQRTRSRPLAAAA